jgi:hypothetical protein
MRITLTHNIDARRSIQATAEGQGGTLRLRAHLVEADQVVTAHRRDYRFSDDTIAQFVADFTAEFAAIAGLFIETLFPADLFSLKCPAAPPHWEDPLVWGIAAGTVEHPQVIQIPPEPLTPDWLAKAEPYTPREVYRIAARCVKGGCRHWQDGANGAEHDGVCSLVERVIAGYPAAVGEKLQPCGIRSVCRWFAQEGPAACRVCPGVVTDLGELPQDAENEKDVAFF